MERGSVYIRHPWESGMDNSPMWDSIMERIQLRPEQIPQYKRADTHFVAAEDRPLDAAYDRFAYLVKLFADRDYDEAQDKERLSFPGPGRALQRAPVPGRDGSCGDRACLGEDPSPFERRAKKTAQAMNGKLWDEEHGIYLDFDLVRGGY